MKIMPTRLMFILTIHLICTASALPKKKIFFTIKGYVKPKDKKIKTFNTYIVIKSENGKDMYKIPTAMVRASDDSQKDNIGFAARIKKSDLTDGECYNVYIFYGNDNERVLLGTAERIRK